MGRSLDDSVAIRGLFRSFLGVLGWTGWEPTERGVMGKRCSGRGPTGVRRSFNQSGGRPINGRANAKLIITVKTVTGTGPFHDAT